MQSTVKLNQGFGVIGELAFDGPNRTITATLDSADAADNVVGRAFFYVDSADDSIVQAGGESVFAGILGLPKTYASRGTDAGGTLAATLTLANGEQGEFVRMGEMIVTLPAAANVGDPVTYNTDNGALGAIAATAEFTGVIAVTTGVLTVSALAAGGYLAPGAVLSGTGVPGGTIITAQLTGTAGLAGTYQTNIVTAVASTAMTAPNSALAAGAGHEFVPNCAVGRLSNDASGLAVITLTN